MSGLPIKYRVRIAFGFFSKGHEFMSPPMSRGEAQVLVSRGLLEEVKPTEEKKPRKLLGKYK